MWPDSACRIYMQTDLDCACCPCRNSIAERYHVEAPATLIFDHPSVAALATWLGGQLMAAHSGAAAAAPSHAAQLVHAALVQQGGAPPLTAVAGLSCSFPAINSSSSAGLPSFWQQAVSGIDVQAPVPLSKWDAGKHLCEAGS